MAEVSLTSIKCGKVRWKGSNCYLVLPESDVPRLDFGYKDANDDHITLRCENITAIDLRVEAKFGSIEAMKGTLLVECTVSQIKTSSLETIDDNQVSLSGKFIKSCLVRATFHVNQTGGVRDVIRKLRGLYPSSNLTHSTESLDGLQRNPKLFKQGLPKWVTFIPHYLYSNRTRQCIEFMIYLYLIFSIMWALWQLYRHVDFIREFVRPLIEFLQYQYRLLDYVINFFSTLFEEYTVQWLCFIKPLYTVTLAMAAPLLQTIKQIGPLLQLVAKSVSNNCSVLAPVVRPVVNIIYQLGYFIYTISRVLKNILARVWFLFFNSIGQAPLDPIKARLVIVRATVIQSSKAVGLGTVHLVKKIYKIVWLRRSTRVEKED